MFKFPYRDEIFFEYGQLRNFKLIYRATENGFNPEDFHKKCDSKGPTIIIYLYCG